MTEQTFQIGARVQLQQALGLLPVGTCGTIVHIYTVVSGLYKVRFEDTSSTQIIPGRWLEAATFQRERGY